MKVLEYRGGRGDSLMLTCVAHEWAKRGEEVGIVTHDPEVFENNPDVKWVIPRESRYHRYFHRMVDVVHPNYLLGFNKLEDTRDPLEEHVLVYMLRKSGITGEVELRPWFHVDEEKFPAGLISEETKKTIICFQSSGIGAQSYSPNKEWIHSRMIEVVKRAKRNVEYLTIQVGAMGDPVLGCDVNLAGWTNLNTLGYVLSKARLFVGLEGMIMHMAAAIGCPSVIIYGGRLKAWQIGYNYNFNLESHCPDQRYKKKGCWRQSKCDFVDKSRNRECMNQISVEDVITGIEYMLDLPREMEYEKRIIDN